LKYLDGTRPTLYDANGLDANDQLEVAASSVYSAGQPGEYLDYFYTLCEDVKVKITRVEDRTTTSSRSTSLFHQIAYLDDLTAAEEKKLKTCLGDSDGDWTNNVDVENWDYGDWSYSLAVKSATITSYTVGSNNAAAIDVENVQSVLDTNNAMVGQYPHAIKLVPVDQDDTKDGGHIYLVWYDSHMTSPRFKLLSNPPYDKVTWSTDTTNEEFYVFTTDGKAQLLQTKQFTFDGNGFNWNNDNPTDADGNDWNDVPVFAWFEAYSNIIYTSADASCESGNTNSTSRLNPTTHDSLADVRAEDNLMDCLSKGDQIFITNGAWGDDRTTSSNGYQFAGNDRDANAPTPSAAGEYTGMLYTIKKIWKEDPGNGTYSSHHLKEATEVLNDRYRIMVDKAINWDGSDYGDPDGDGVYNTGYQYIFKFNPNTSYSYVSECSNRGLCNRESGLCECFTGYTNDNCNTQSSLAV